MIRLKTAQHRRFQRSHYFLYSVVSKYSLFTVSPTESFWWQEYFFLDSVTKQYFTSEKNILAQDFFSGRNFFFISCGTKKKCFVTIKEDIFLASGINSVGVLIGDQALPDASHGNRRVKFLWKTSEFPLYQRIGNTTQDVEFVTLKSFRAASSLFTSNL